MSATDRPRDRLVDYAGTHVEAGDHVVSLGDQLTPVLVVRADAATGRLSTLAGADLLARHTRVVTVRDAHGARLGDGDTVVGVDQVAGAAGPTWVIARVNYAAGMLALAGGPEGRQITVTLPALVVRVSAAVTAGDQVIDDVGMFGVVLEDAGDGWVTVEPLLTDGPVVRRRRGELRRALEAHPGVREYPDGWAVPVLDAAAEARAAADVAAIIADTWVPNVVPLPRRAG